MLTLFKERGWLKAHGKQRTDSTHVLAKIRAINRPVCVGETLRRALNALAMVAPERLLAHSQPEWVDRYGVRLEDSLLPESDQDRQAWTQSVGQDGASLLSTLVEPEVPSWVREVPDLITHVETTTAPVSDNAKTATIHEGLKHE